MVWDTSVDTPRVLYTRVEKHVNAGDRPLTYHILSQ